MKNLNKAFTLTELLVALGVIGILTAILLPVIFNMMPNQNTLMAKRAYYTVQSVLSELINDEACYPDKTASITDKKMGFDDAVGTVNCTNWDETHTGTSSNDAALKLYTLFTDKLGIEPESSYNTKFTTSDGMIWGFSNADFRQVMNTTATDYDKDGGTIKLTVDVNGDAKPNCGGNGYAYASILGGDDSACTGRTSGFDRFQMIIKGNGQVNIKGSDVWAINAVKVNRNITSDKNSNAEDDSAATTSSP